MEGLFDAAVSKIKSLDRKTLWKIIAIVIAGFVLLGVYQSQPAAKLKRATSQALSGSYESAEKTLTGTTGKEAYLLRTYVQMMLQIKEYAYAPTVSYVNRSDYMEKVEVDKTTLEYLDAIQQTLRELLQDKVYLDSRIVGKLNRMNEDLKSSETAKNLDSYFNLEPKVVALGDLYRGIYFDKDAFSVLEIRATLETYDEAVLQIQALWDGFKIEKSEYNLSDTLTERISEVLEEFDESDFVYISKIGENRLKIRSNTYEIYVMTTIDRLHTTEQVLTRNLYKQLLDEQS